MPISFIFQFDLQSESGSLSCLPLSFYVFLANLSIPALPLRVDFPCVCPCTLNTRPVRPFMVAAVRVKFLLPHGDIRLDGINRKRNRFQSLATMRR